MFCDITHSLLKTKNYIRSYSVIDDLRRMLQSIMQCCFFGPFYNILTVTNVKKSPVLSYSECNICPIKITSVPVYDISQNAVLKKSVRQKGASDLTGPVIYLLSFFSAKNLILNIFSSPVLTCYVH